MKKIILLLLISTFTYINVYASEDDDMLNFLFGSTEEVSNNWSNNSALENTSSPTLVNDLTNNWWNIEVNHWSKVNESLNASKWENIENNDCMLYPESCNWWVTINPAWEWVLPELNAAQEEEVSYTWKAQRLPTTWPTEIFIWIIALILAFFILKFRRKA